MVLTCPLIPGDRNVYLDLVDALKRDVSAIASINGGSSELGGGTEPKTTILDVRGSAYRGSLSILGVDGAGVFTVFVNLDLAIHRLGAKPDGRRQGRAHGGRRRHRRRQPR